MTIDFKKAAEQVIQSRIAREAIANIPRQTLENLFAEDKAAKGLFNSMSNSECEKLLMGTKHVETEAIRDYQAAETVFMKHLGSENAIGLIGAMQYMEYIMGQLKFEHESISKLKRAMMMEDISKRVRESVLATLRRTTT